MNKSLPPEAIIDILQRGADLEVIGLHETERVEFKGQYRLTEQGEKWELAKDVAAFANIGGGLIVVGVTSEQDIDRAEDRAATIKPIPSEMFDPKQIYDILREWVYPPPRVEVVRYPRADKALGSIYIHAQDRHAPFLVTRIPDDAGRFQAHTGVGWPYRGGTHTTWTPVGQIHARISGGRLELDREPAHDFAKPHEKLTELVNDIEAMMGWTDQAILYLVGRPRDLPEGPLDRFYSEDGVLGAIARPFELRHAGFGLTYGRFQTDETGRLISSDEERLLLLYPNGLTAAALAAGPHFLTRGGGRERPSAPESRTINPLVVTEWTYLFCRLVADHLAVRASGPWQLTIGLRGAKSRPWSLKMRPGLWTAAQGVPFLADGVPPGPDSWEESVAATLDPSRDSYVLLDRLYNVFGQDFDTLNLAEAGAIAAERIVNLGTRG